MTRISFNKILIAFFVIFLMSRTRKILQFFSGLEPGKILTLEPLRECPEEMRYVVTLAFLSLCFVVLWQLFLRKR